MTTPSSLKRSMSGEKIQVVVEWRLKVKEVEAEVEDVGGLKLEEGKEEGRQGREEECRRSSRKGSRLDCRADAETSGGSRSEEVV